MYICSGGVLSPKGYGPNRRRGLGHPADDPGSFWGCPPCLCGVWCLRPASTRPRITDARRDAQCVSRLLRLIPGYIKAGGLKPPEQTPLQPDHSTTPSSQTSNPDPSSTGSERVCGPHKDRAHTWVCARWFPLMGVPVQRCGGIQKGRRQECQHPGVMPAHN